VHVDQTPASAEARVNRHLPPSDVPDLLAKRYQIINLWRPIHHAAVDHPLAMCDYRSTLRLGVKDGKLTTEGTDFVPLDVVYDDKKGEGFGVKFNPEHRWKYVRGLEPDELLLIKWYAPVFTIVPLFAPLLTWVCPLFSSDSASAQDPSIAALVPHTAFKDPSTPIDAPLRESIELRTLVFYD
jgi:hypothetical protein